ncbi:hypothetical protein AOLI_G00205030 [Acnodon oligacanthus]
MWPTEEDGGVYFTRDNLLLQDGGIIALDWAVGLKDHKAQAEKDHPPGGRVLGCHTSNPPIIILIPNALGKITQHFLSLCCLALQQGFYPVVFHRRGHGSCPLTTPRYQQFGDPSDLVQAVAYLRNRHPSSVLLACSMDKRGLTPLPWLYNEAALLYRKLQLSRYATALSSVMDVETILCSRSLQDMERLIFCSARQQDNYEMDTLDQAREPRSRSSMKPDWAGYWDRNEPLRDADEVAVPVLCLCSSDDPLLPPSSTLPLSLFRNSPYFFLALTTRGSHCGFMQEKHGGIECWSHEAVLEYFQAVGNFFKVEERNFVREGFVGHGAVQGLRQRMYTVSPRKRRAVIFRREKPVFGPQRQLSVHSGLVPFEEEHDTFTWNRSYTR